MQVTYAHQGWFYRPRWTVLCCVYAPSSDVPGRGDLSVLAVGGVIILLCL